jgi:2-succinyl-5-enolpyruvyl-6-hydroxy-3-cyclohexene-1-carboxylate synthase
MSGARRGAAAIAYYDALLRSPRFSAALEPDLVLRVGDLPVSKALRTWLAGLDHVRQVALDPEAAWQDPSSVLSDSLTIDPATVLGALAKEGLATAEDAWLQRWRSGDELAAEAISGALQADRLSEPRIAAELGVLLPAEATLFVASSMPVRDIESFWPVRTDPPRVLCNRGANGIDGIVSSAFGAAAAEQGPVVLLIGDVALAHDLGGLLAAGRLDVQLTIVLLNNGGGGIFDFLPVAENELARERDIYTNHIATPTGLEFAQAAKLYGVIHELAEDAPSFRTALERSLSGEASYMIEVRGERGRNRDLHARVWAAVEQAQQ